MFAAYSKDYLTELVASVAVASPQHQSVDSLTDFAVNLTAGPLFVVAAVAKECSAAEFAAEKAAGAWTVDVAAASLQIVQAAGVMIAQIVVLNSMDFVEYHSVQLTASPWTEFVEYHSVEYHSVQLTFASWAAVKIASVLAATKFAAAECAVASVNSAAISGSSTISAVDKLTDYVLVVAAAAAAAYLPFVFVQHTYPVEYLVLNHCSWYFEACQTDSAASMSGQD